jgi:hypothetical protein
MGVVQPEIGHAGITEFIHIGRIAQTFHVNTIPHASISIGMFMAASLVTSSALQRVPYHEYQHSVFNRNLSFVAGDIGYRNGHYHIPTAPGLGVEPEEELFNYWRGEPFERLRGVSGWVAAAWCKKPFYLIAQDSKIWINDSNVRSLKYSNTSV